MVWPFSIGTFWTWVNCRFTNHFSTSYSWNDALQSQSLSSGWPFASVEFLSRRFLTTSWLIGTLLNLSSRQLLAWWVFWTEAKIKTEKFSQQESYILDCTVRYYLHLNCWSSWSRFCWSWGHWPCPPFHFWATLSCLMRLCQWSS